MKRLLTIFVSSVLGMGLYAQQTVPMTIVGDVYNAGNMVSKGDVHIKAVSATDDKAGDARVGRLDNHGNLDVKQAIILYTNDTADGLLSNNRNKGEATFTSHDISSANVIVRKTFTGGGYYLSLPFDVELATGVKNATTGETLANETDFQVNFYDSKKRSESGSNEGNWTQISLADNSQIAEVIPGATKTNMRKGAAYLVYIDPAKFPANKKNANGEVVIDFTAKASDIPALLKNDDKGTTLTYFAPAPNLQPGETATKHWSDGWNIIGGLSTDLFLLNENTVEYGRASYYWNEKSPEWQKGLPEAEAGILRPYGVMFVRIDSTDNKTFNKANISNPLLRGANKYGGYAFYYEGNVISSPDPSYPVYRSLQENLPANDLFTLYVNNEQDNISERTHFKFNDKFTSYYKSGEQDDVNLPLNRKITDLWSVAPYIQEGVEYGSALFVNSLSYSDDQEVPLGINLPQGGSYTFSIAQKADAGVNKLRNIFLYDTELNKTVDLLQSDYEFTIAENSLTEFEYKNSRGEILNDKSYLDSDRFVLYFNSNDITGTGNLPSVTEIYAYAENNVLTVRNLMQGDRVQVFDLSGRTIVNGVASGNIFTAPLNQKGVYIVNVRGGKALRVLNK